jgi:hypothetical protein
MNKTISTAVGSRVTLKTRFPSRFVIETESGTRIEGTVTSATPLVVKCGPDIKIFEIDPLEAEIVPLHVVEESPE